MFDAINSNDNGEQKIQKIVPLKLGQNKNINEIHTDHNQSGKGKGKDTIIISRYKIM